KGKDPRRGGINGERGQENGRSEDRRRRGQEKAGAEKRDDPPPRMKTRPLDEEAAGFDTIAPALREIRAGEGPAPVADADRRIELHARSGLHRPPDEVGVLRDVSERLIEAANGIEGPPPREEVAERQVVR